MTRPPDGSPVIPVAVCLVAHDGPRRERGGRSKGHATNEKTPHDGGVCCDTADATACRCGLQPTRTCREATPASACGRCPRRRRFGAKCRDPNRDAKRRLQCRSGRRGSDQDRPPSRSNELDRLYEECSSLVVFPFKHFVMPSPQVDFVLRCLPHGMNRDRNIAPELLSQVGVQVVQRDRTKLARLAFIFGVDQHVAGRPWRQGRWSSLGSWCFWFR